MSSVPVGSLGSTSNLNVIPFIVVNHLLFSILLSKPVIINPYLLYMSGSILEGCSTVPILNT